MLLHLNEPTGKDMPQGLGSHCMIALKENFLLGNYDSDDPGTAFPSNAAHIPHFFPLLQDPSITQTFPFNNKINSAQFALGN